MWHWTPSQVNDLWLDEFWGFLTEFEDMAKKSKKGKKDYLNPDEWLRNPRYHGKEK